VHASQIIGGTPRHRGFDHFVKDTSTDVRRDRQFPASNYASLWQVGAIIPSRRVGFERNVGRSSDSATKLMLIRQDLYLIEGLNSTPVE
jgi:hypothetical protein